MNTQLSKAQLSSLTFSCFLVPESGLPALTADLGLCSPRWSGYSAGGPPGASYQCPGQAYWSGLLGTLRVRDPSIHQSHFSFCLVVVFH